MECFEIEVGMNLQAVFHEAKSKYAYAFDPETLHIRIRTAINDIDSVTLIGGDPFRWIRSEVDPAHWEWDSQSGFDLPMHLEYQTEFFDYWFIEVKPRWKRIRYGFILRSGLQEILYINQSFHDLNLAPQFRNEINSFFNFPYLNYEDVYQAPAWVKDTIWYQIFPERFADGNPSNNPKGSLRWGLEEKDSPSIFYGGDLQGVIEHMDYLQDLGINGIYFTPIFTSPSNHKYDTTNYYEIDPAFGTNELFRSLVVEAHSRGIKIMLDAVFNHCGWFHPFWQDVVKNGSKSKYFECFFIDREPVINFEVQEGKLPKINPEEMGKLNYRTFAFAPYMPKWNTGHPLVREHLLGVVRYWTEQFGVDGWRLDVSNEVSHDFWREFRKSVHEINPDVYILGENWDNSTPWLHGDQFDGVMNYELTYPIWNLLGKKDRVIESLDVKGYQNQINQFLVSYPKNILPNMYNLLDSHDTPRIDFKCDANKFKIKLAYALEMTFTGSPSIYYGSEVGLQGPDGKNRRCMHWDAQEQDLDLYQHVHTLVHLRKKHLTFRSIDIFWIDVNQKENYFIFKKTTEDECLYFIANLNDQIKTIKLPEEMIDRKYDDLMEGKEIFLKNHVVINPFAFFMFSSIK